MAREILLRLRTRNYDRAKEVAQRVAERARKTLETAKVLRDELRQGLDRAQKTAELRQRASALGRRGGAASGRDVFAGQRAGFGELLGTVGAAREKGESFAQLLFGGGSPSQTIPALISGAGQFVPGLGPFMALLGPLTEKLLGYLEERLQQELKKQEERINARLEEDRFRMDYARRFQEDPRFAREQAREALARTLAEEAVLGKRIQKTTADLLTDFGL